MLLLFFSVSLGFLNVTEFVLHVVFSALKKEYLAHFNFGIWNILRFSAVCTHNLYRKCEVFNALGTKKTHFTNQLVGKYKLFYSMILNTLRLILIVILLHTTVSLLISETKMAAFIWDTHAVHSWEHILKLNNSLCGWATNIYSVLKFLLIPLFRLIKTWKHSWSWSFCNDPIIIATFIHL